MKKEKRIAWICLIASGLTEIAWAYFMKESHGFTILVPSALAVVFIAVGFFLLERGVRAFGIGMAYGVFTGIGIAGTTIIGILVLEEGAGWLKIMSVAVLMTGIIGLKFCDGKEVREQ